MGHLHGQWGGGPWGWDQGGRGRPGPPPWLAEIFGMTPPAPPRRAAGAAR